MSQSKSLNHKEGMTQKDFIEKLMADAEPEVSDKTIKRWMTKANIERNHSAGTAPTIIYTESDLNKVKSKHTDYYHITPGTIFEGIKEAAANFEEKYDDEAYPEELFNNLIVHDSVINPDAPQLETEEMRKAARQKDVQAAQQEVRRIQNELAKLPYFPNSPDVVQRATLFAQEALLFDVLSLVTEGGFYVDREMLADDMDEQLRLMYQSDLEESARLTYIELRLESNKAWQNYVKFESTNESVADMLQNQEG